MLESDPVVAVPQAFKQALAAAFSVFRMTKKRKSRGRSKGGKGSSGFISCSNCGAHVPRDKAKKVTTRLSMVEPLLARELRAAGAYIAAPDNRSLLLHQLFRTLWNSERKSEV